MAKKPEPPKPATWTIYKIAKKQVWLGIVEAPDVQRSRTLRLNSGSQPRSCTRWGGDDAQG
jgi:hypothetical protein